MLNAAQVETCSEPLLRAGKDAARALDVPIHTHAGGNLIEFERIMEEYRKTPVQYLADIGFLDDAHAARPRRLHDRSSMAALPVRRRSRVLAETGATVGHCPYKYAKMAMTLHSVPAVSRGRA
jgi:cytosine/adenosine deaminase-related metal-dependent hydrolase